MSAYQPGQSQSGLRLKPAAGARRWRAKRPSTGQSLVEYTLLVALIGLVLVIGEDSPLEALARAVQGYYGRFTFALAMP